MSTSDTTRVQLPQLQVFQRVLGLPMIELVLAKSALTYSRVKDSHQLIHWVFSTAESSLTTATNTAVPIAAPIVSKFETPIQFFDRTLCFGLDKIEKSIPMVKESPEQILEKSYMFALQTVQPAISTISYANEVIKAQASSFKDFSWNKANQLLSTHYGTAAVHKLDSTAVVVDKLIDRYFPANGVEQSIEPTSSEEDQLLHTLTTVGRLSNKAARRVYSHVVQNLAVMGKGQVGIYIGNVVEFLQIAQYLHAINEKVQQFTSPKKKPEKNPDMTNGHVKSE